nr:MAG TPA: hypothetical protein [Caudoviricetes sp.]
MDYLHINTLLRLPLLITLQIKKLYFCSLLAIKIIN